jgi:short-subunit dehydrogenase
VRGTKTFVPMMKAQGSGTIVNTASLAGLVHPAGMASYNAVKAAVVAFSETAGHELAEYGINVAVVCPSYFRTPLVDNMQGTDTAVGAVIGALVANSPVSADDIAAAILAGLENGDEVILPDEAAQAAYGFKVADRAGYNALMRKQAARLNAME